MRDLEERFWEKVLIGDGCWNWTASKHKFGYGWFGIGRTLHTAHRISYQLSNGPVPEGLCVLHRCDNPSCVRPGHLFLGTQAENMHDMGRKGRNGLRRDPSRAARGDRHSSRTKPESIHRGDAHWTRRMPELLKRGDSHWSHRTPEKVTRGDQHYARTRPEALARGDRNGSRLHPECVPRGERNGNAKLSADKVAAMRIEYSAGGITQRQLASKYGVSQHTVYVIVNRKGWIGGGPDR